jgi:hypothetical protein
MNWKEEIQHYGYMALLAAVLMLIIFGLFMITAKTTR